MEEPSTEPAPPTGKEPESASPPAAAPAAAANEQEVAPVEATYEEQPVAASESGLSTPSKAQVVFRDTQQLFQRLSVQARDAAVVAGQKLDQAALSLGAAVDNYAIQVRCTRVVIIVSMVQHTTRIRHMLTHTHHRQQIVEFPMLLSCIGCCGAGLQREDSVTLYVPQLFWKWSN